MKLKRLAVLSIALAIVMVICTPALAAKPGKIDLNTASVKELAQLKRVGMKYAERIVKYREEHGPFKTPEDITKVPGIGPKTLELNKEIIVVE